LLKWPGYHSWFKTREELDFWAILKLGPWRDSMTECRFVLVDFRYTSDAVGHIRLYEAGCTYAMPRALAHAAAKRELVTLQQPDDWTPPSILRPPEVLTESEVVEADGELKALQRHALAIVDPEVG
jgi:hypothetical protein